MKNELIISLVEELKRVNIKENEKGREWFEKMIHQKIVQCDQNI